MENLGVKTYFEFILSFLPKDYKSGVLSRDLAIDTQSVLEVKVLNYSHFKIAKVLCFAPLFSQEIELVIFNAKPYHKSIFKKGEHLVVSGKLQKNMGFYQLIQPQIIKEVGKITPIFNARGAKSLLLQNFCKEINAQNLVLQYANIPINFLESLERIYNPNEVFFKTFKKNHGFFDKYLDSIKFVEIYEHIRKLKTKKRVFKSLAKLQGNIDSWIKSLPFLLTNGQLKAIADIKKSLNSEQSARRVIIGDVGCGKTMIIFASVLLALPKRSILMAPTSILAKQIYEESKKFLPQNLSVALLTQSSKIGDVENCDFLIGTHAVLYKDLKDFSLVMIDEQHRFGTAQRNTLERMFEDKSRRPHILQFSATPIPRTLAMIESSFLDFSFIKDLPFKKDITSKVIHKNDFKELLAHLKKELNARNQAIIVYPLVEQSDAMDYLSLKEGEEFWKKNFSGVYVTHGKDREKEATLEEFREKGSILLATTVIEVGISLPKLSTIVIVGAERLGLATLHQLRGRVSRNGLKGYCFLYTNMQKNERLERFCGILNGFEIAQMDLEYRNSGDLLSGEAQSGKQFNFINLTRDEKIIAEAKKALDRD